MNSLCRRPGTVAAILTAVFVLPSPATAQASDEMRSIRDGVYSEPQARRGEETFQQVCSECHVEDEFLGLFLPSWDGATIGELFELVTTTMPEDRPGALEGAEYVQVLTYIFELNGIPAGSEELPATQDVLDRILIQANPSRLPR